MSIPEDGRLGKRSRADKILDEYGLDKVRRETLSEILDRLDIVQREAKKLKNRRGAWDGIDTVARKTKDLAEWKKQIEKLAEENDRLALKEDAMIDALLENRPFENKQGTTLISYLGDTLMKNYNTMQKNNSAITQKNNDLLKFKGMLVKEMSRFRREPTELECMSTEGWCNYQKELAACHAKMLDIHFS